MQYFRKIWLQFFIACLSCKGEPRKSEQPSPVQANASLLENLQKATRQSLNRVLNHDDTSTQGRALSQQEGTKLSQGKTGQEGTKSSQAETELNEKYTSFNTLAQEMETTCDRIANTTITYSLQKENMPSALKLDSSSDSTFSSTFDLFELVIKLIPDLNIDQDIRKVIDNNSEIIILLDHYKKLADNQKLSSDQKIDGMNQRFTLLTRKFTKVWAIDHEQKLFKLLRMKWQAVLDQYRPLRTPIAVPADACDEYKILQGMLDEFFSINFLVQMLFSILEISNDLRLLSLMKNDDSIVGMLKELQNELTKEELYALNSPENFELLYRIHEYEQVLTGKAEAENIQYLNTIQFYIKEPRKQDTPPVYDACLAEIALKTEDFLKACEATKTEMPA